VREIGPLIWLLLLAVTFYFLLIRPARTRQRQALEVQRSLRPGQEVVTTAGLYATVTGVEDEVVLLEVAPGVVCRYAKGAVARVLTPQPEPGNPGAGPDAAPGEDGPAPGPAGPGTDGPEAGEPPRERP
jgi:preprotein translocase subunit YajC